jgi:hypothetical protein
MCHNNVRARAGDQAERQLNDSPVWGRLIQKDRLRQQPVSFYPIKTVLSSHFRNGVGLTGQMGDHQLDIGRCEQNANENDDRTERSN